jgi:integrase
MPKPLPPLTAVKIAQTVAKRPNPRVTLRDGACPGLSLIVGPMSATWSLHVSAPERKRFTIGHYPAIPLAVARKLAVEKREHLARYYPTSSAQNASTGLLTLEDLITTYGGIVGVELKTWRKNGACRLRNVFARHLDTPLHHLTIAALQLTADAHPARSTAQNAVNALRPMLKWARKRELIDLDARDLERPRMASKPRERVLSDEELKQILPALDMTGRDAVLRFILLTLCRRSEAAEATWGEFDLPNALWTIPAGRTKSARTIQIPLSAQAVALLENQPKTAKTIFSVGNFDQQWWRYSTQIHARTGTSGWHRHDLRRTSATILAEKLSVPPHIVEVALGHANLHSPLASIYNRSRYLREHAAALQALADYYDTIVTD